MITQTMMYVGSMHGSGMGDVGRVIAHSIIWTTVAGFVRAQPGWVALGMAVLAGLWIVTRNGGRRRPGMRAGRAGASEAAGSAGRPGPTSRRCPHCRSDL